MADANRIEWLNLGKAISILLVVVYHARHSAYLIDWHHADQIGPVWEAAGDLLRPLRMPFFFLMSGLLAAPSLGQPWERVRLKRVYRPFYLYALWAAILMLLIPAFPRLGPLDGGLAFKLVLILCGSTVAWYLYALGLFYLFCRATDRLDARLVAALALGIAVLAAGLEGRINDFLFSMMRCLVFFAVGARFRQPILDWAARASWPRLCGLAAAAAGLFAASDAIGLPTNPVLDSAAVMLGITATVLVARGLAFARTLGNSLSTRTLPIYLLHFPLVAALPPVADSLLPEVVLGSMMAGLLFPLVLSAIAVMASLGLYAAALKCGGRWLFNLPGLARAGSDRNLPAPRGGRRLRA